MMHTNKTMAKVLRTKKGVKEGHSRIWGERGQKWVKEKDRNKRLVGGKGGGERERQKREIFEK